MSAIPTTSRSGNAGFTLVEMMVAMLIMTVGLLGLLQSVSAAYKQCLRTRVRDEAALLAESTMHEWCRMGFDAISAPAANPRPVDRLIGGASRRFEVTRGMEGMGSLASSGKSTKKLTVVVAWTINGETINHQIFTLKSK